LNANATSFITSAVNRGINSTDYTSALGRHIHCSAQGNAQVEMYSLIGDTDEHILSNGRTDGQTDRRPRGKRKHAAVDSTDPDM